MKLCLEEDLTQEEILVLIRYARMTPAVRRLETLVRAAAQTVRCTAGEGAGETWVGAGDICYVESVDKKTFVCTEAAVYRSNLRLYQLLETLAPAGFVQVSKACLLNINMAVGIVAKPNSRMEATLRNGERVEVTRKYIPAIKKKLQER